MRMLGLLVLLPVAAGAPLLTAVSPDAPGGEAVAITSASSWDLSGWSLTDGEGTWSFPAGAALVGGEEAWIVSDPETWLAAGGHPPAWTFGLKLSNGGDDIALVDATGNVVDAFAWGDKTHPDMAGSIPYTSDALVYRRADPVSDTDSADDWRTPRTHRVGDTDWPRAAFQVNVTAYASPDASFGVLRGLIEAASMRLHLHVYELEHIALADALAAAARRGVDVQVLVEDNPVGRWIEEERLAAALARQLQEAGAEVFEAGRVRYAFHHLKVLVADDAVSIQSENWVPSGVPQGNFGNRGWGVVVQDAPFAHWMAGVLEADRLGPETTRFWSDAPAMDVWAVPPQRGDYRPFPPQSFANVTVVPVISPDQTADPARDPVIALLQEARRSIWVQHMDLRLEAKNPLGWWAPDPLTGALMAAARMGIDVRVMAAAPFDEDDLGNREVLAALDQAGATVREWDHPALGIMHNKGIIIDGEAVVVGSMNGNHHSRANNREVSIIIHSPKVADYYERLFLDDWAGGRVDRGAILDDVRSLPAAPLPILLATVLVVTACRCCRS